MIVAYLALFVALGGASYAVTIAPRNSVNSASIIDDAARGVDVKESSLRGVTDRCPSPLTVRRGRVCAGSDGVARTWDGAMDFCTGLGLTLPSVSQATRLARLHDVPGTNGDFWTETYWESGSSSHAWVVFENGGRGVSTFPGSFAAVCVTNPSDAR